MASSADDGHGGGELNMLKLEESLSNSNFGFSDSVDRLGEQSPMAQSSPLTRSFSMSTDGREALNNYGVVLGLLEEQKREKDCQIVELKREKEELKKDLRDKQTEMNVRIERLQSEKQNCERELQIEKEKGAEKQAKIIELECEIQKLRFQPNGIGNARRGGEQFLSPSCNGTFRGNGHVESENYIIIHRGEEPINESTKSKVFAFDLSNSHRAASLDCYCDPYTWREEKMNFGDSASRRDFALANIGRRIFISGGSINGVITRDCQCIDLFSGEAKLQAVSQMQKPRAEHFALTIDNQIYVFGGDDDSSIECLDDIKGEWNLSGKLLEKRKKGAAGAVLDGCAYVIGGQQTNSSNHLLNSIERFDRRVGKCEKVAAIFKEGLSGASAAEFNGKIYIAGGYDSLQNQLTVKIYDPRADKLIIGPKMNNIHENFALISNGDHLLAIDGRHWREGKTIEVLRPVDVDNVGSPARSMGWVTYTAEMPLSKYGGVRAVLV